MKRIYYGWTMLALLAMAQVTSWGILYYSFAVFLTPVREDRGWSTAEITGAYSLALLLSGLAAVPVGRWLDRHGPRLLMTAGSVAAVLLVLALASVERLWAYYLVWAGIGLVMAAVLYEPAFQIVAVWFNRRRSGALTLLTFIGGFASVIYLPLSGWLVETYGWREALVILAVVLAAGTIPIHALALRRRPSDLGLDPDGGPGPPNKRSAATTAPRPAITADQALRDPAFWWLAAAFVLSMVATMAVTVHLIPYLVEQGYSAGFAAGAGGLIGLFALPGRLVFTPLGSKVPRRFITALIFALQTAALVVLVLGGTTGAVLAFIVLFGAGFGAITPARAALVADMYGAANYGSINGVLALCITLARAVAPVGTGLLASSLGYAPMLWIMVALSGLASLAALRTTSRLAESIEAPLVAPATRVEHSS